MKFVLTSVTLLVVFKLLAGQQCRYVIEPDCSLSDDASVVQNGGFFGRSTKGEKGERGYSGKIGPKGSDGAAGPKGEMGQKGMKGDPAESVEELTRRVDGECFSRAIGFLFLKVPENRILQKMQICSIKLMKTTGNFSEYSFGEAYDLNVFDAYLRRSTEFFF